MTPLQAYEKSISTTNKVTFWKNGMAVDVRFIKDIGDARLLQYAMNWDNYTYEKISN